MYRQFSKLNVLIYLLFLSGSRPLAAVELGLQSYFGFGSSNLSSEESSNGFALYGSQALWQLADWDLGLSMRLVNETISGKAGEQGRRRLDTIESNSLQAGFYTRRQIGQGFWSFMLVGGPSQSRLRINDSTPQSATIYRGHSLAGWQAALTSSYQYPIADGVNALVGLMWRNTRIRIGAEPLSYFAQDYTGGGLTLTEGSATPQGVEIPEQIRSENLAIEFGVSFSL